MKFNLFKKRHIDEQQSKTCPNLKESNDCSLVAQLRQLQNEHSEVAERVETLLKESDVPEINKFLKCYQLSWAVDYYRFRTDSSLNDEDIIRECFNCIDSDKFIEEITLVHTKKQLIKQERKKIAQLDDQIDDIKQQLGIK